VRNFSIVAHVDHGKSTLADRLLEITGVIEEGRQVLDHLPVERERGITVKAQTASMVHLHRGDRYLLNLIDTPGHVDFSYEVSRSLAASQGVLLLVDAQQGVQAQTVANFLLSFEANLAIIPVINKIDLPLANVERVNEQLHNVFGFSPEEGIQISAKHGTGIDKVFSAIIEKIPSPSGSRDKPLCLLLFDSWYDHYRGVVCVVAVNNGSIGVGDEVSSYHTGLSYEVAEVGLLQTKRVPIPRLYSGQVGYVLLGMRNSTEAHIGDTFYHAGSKVTPLPGFRAAKPMVFAGFYPMDQSEYPVLRTALEKLTLSDSSVSVFKDSSVALGQGWRLGFLGLLHMDVVQERLEREYELTLLATAPSVAYRVVTTDGETREVDNPSFLPPQDRIEEVQEPWVDLTVIAPANYIGVLIELVRGRRGEYVRMEYIQAGSDAGAGQDNGYQELRGSATSSRVLLEFRMPLSEMLIDFYDQLKSKTQGYASMDYSMSGYRADKLVRLDILVNGEPVDALSLIVHRDLAFTTGRELVSRLKELIPRQLFEVPIQAAIGSRIMARETIRALRKNVLAKCYGGDVTRKRKLLEKQAEGKRRMKRVGRVEIPQEAFLSMLKMER
jgi:elongation factor 4